MQGYRSAWLEHERDCVRPASLGKVTAVSCFHGHFLQSHDRLFKVIGVFKVVVAFSKSCPHIQSHGRVIEVVADFRRSHGRSFNKGRTACSNSHGLSKGMAAFPKVIAAISKFLAGFAKYNGYYFNVMAFSKSLSEDSRLSYIV